MKRYVHSRVQVTVALFSIMIPYFAAGQAAQTPAQSSPSPGTPRLIKFSGTIKDATGNWLANTVGVTFAIYSEQTGGVPLWQETQNVQFASGHYLVLLGQTTSTGIPAELFASGDPRWLGVRPLLSDEEERPRVLLTSVPYALKAVDADTVGGLPPSAFIRANGSNSVSAIGTLPSGTVRQSVTTPSSPVTVSSGGTAGTIPQFDSPTDLTNSPIVVNSAPTDLADTVEMANLQVRNLENVRYADQYPGTGNHDIGDKINQAYAACPANGCKIKVSAGIYPYTTPINFSTFGKPVLLEGDAGEAGTYKGNPPGNATTELYYTATSGTAITMATWGGTGSGIQGITLFGPGFSGSNAAVGLSLATGDVKQTYRDLLISGFNVGIEIGSNVYLDYFYNLQMLDNVKAIYAPAGISGTGENIAFFGGVITNKSAFLPGGGGTTIPFYPNCVDFEGGQGIVVSFYNISFDQCGVTLNIPGGQQFFFSGSHFENPGAATGNDFLTIGNNCVSCNVVLSGSDILEDRTTGNRTELITIGGGARLSIFGGIYLAVGKVPQAIKSTHPANAVTVLGADKLNSISSWVGGNYASLVTMNPREYQPLSIAGGPIILGNNLTAHGNVTSAPLSGVRTWNFPDASGTVLVSTTGGNVSVPGNLTVTGQLNVTGAKHFEIDDPLDPANKLLYHTSVESPDMMNIYNGTTVLDANGEAEIQLPDWFEALNRDFRYQLTCIGGFAPVYVAREIEHNTFRVAGGTSGLKVSWQVTGIRHDAYAEAHRSPVEVEKPAGERGHYLHPELFGASSDKAISAH